MKVKHTFNLQWSGGTAATCSKLWPSENYMFTLCNYKFYTHMKAFYSSESLCNYDMAWTKRTFMFLVLWHHYLKLFAIDEPNKSKQGDKQQKQQSTLSTLSVTDLKVLVVKKKKKRLVSKPVSR